MTKLKQFSNVVDFLLGLGSVVPNQHGALFPEEFWARVSFIGC